MKKSKDWDDIEVNRRSDDKIYFESNLIQQISDGIDFLRDESKEVLKEIDLENKIDEMELEEFAEDTINQIDDIFDDISRFKSSIISSDDLPENVKRSYRETQSYLNRDADYVRRARRKLDKLQSDSMVDHYKTNVRVIELADKAIDVNSENFDAYYLKGQALANLEEYDGAIEEFINCLVIRDDVEVWLAIADTNRLNEEYNDAINVYDSILDKNDSCPQALIGKAYTYYDWQKFAKADEFFKQADSIEPLDDESKKMWDDCLAND
ncbi:MAG: tetratricopeptide repeat protein [Methanobrevibacter sp.]|uniref:tetratricopeptide repeat protein n=1 Tax=Methanobrevibacter sp. TaxID=66852 RepID=UPI0025F7E20C|nr:tetratricopeptide repeat protein [Methanobrevibacter sp.]MBQ6099369.1 tetratricopeptide repeat protein [Methanobrevibacter sp.]